MKQPRMRRILDRAFKGVEIVDAKQPLLLFPTQEDFAGATRMDPTACGFSHCVARVCGSTQAHFFKRYVYIDHLGEDGKRRVYRYCITSRALEAIEKFDRGGKVNVKRAFKLRPPGKSETIQGMRNAQKAWSKSNAGKAILAEKRARKDLQIAERQLEQAVNIGKATDAIPGSAKARDVGARIKSAREQLSKARDAFGAATKKSKEVRRATYGTAKAKPRQYDLKVRSGTGAWLSTPQ